MAKVRVAAFSISLDGFGAGPRQDINNPLGVRGTEVHNWFFQTNVFEKIKGQASGGSRGVDNDMAIRSFENVGAWIMGRNMFGPVRGHGLMKSGRDGGARNLLFTCQPLC